MGCGRGLCRRHGLSRRGRGVGGNYAGVITDDGDGDDDDDDGGVVFFGGGGGVCGLGWIPRLGLFLISLCTVCPAVGTWLRTV